tara:strand:+ start:79 stop:432 length:354 start_codon:yes stop_codon:yes gene_type:complete
MKIVIDADLSVDLNEGSYYLELEEFNANLPSDVIDKLINEERYDSEIFSTSNLPGGVAPEDREKLKVNVKDGKVINDENLIFSIGELLEACGWFENNDECYVDSISVNGSAVRIHIY